MSEVATEIFKVVYEMFAALFAALPRILSFILWLAAACIILPAVFIAGTIYPWWMEWGEDF